MDEIEWLGTKAAASYLGVTPHTLYRLIDDGLPAYRLGISKTIVKTPRVNTTAPRIAITS
jgi:excisionase family DNA binding protein